MVRLSACIEMLWNERPFAERIRRTAALGVLADHPELLDRLGATAARLAEACGVPAPAGAVMSVRMPGPHEAVDAVERARAHGIRIGCFRPPSTPDGSSRLRLTAHADLDDADLERACAVLETLVPDHG